ncbi:hypothetical protein ACEQ8H_004920 [Pleosporales sp. CAS-2024a]
MAKTLVGALALAALPSALAFSNTSPLFLFSTADLLLPNADASIAQASQTTTDLLNALKDCPTRSYVVIEQRGVSSADYVDARSMPVLSSYMSGKQKARTTLAIPDVVGQIDARAIVSHLQSKCGYKAGLEVIAAPSADNAYRTTSLHKSDDLIDELIAQSQDYTVVYITTPIDEKVAQDMLEEQHPPYEMESAFGNYEQFELKRDLSAHVTRANATNEGGLFERYQYFTPGLFMAFTAIIPLFLILVVGIKALTSLEVSYFAFSKEMGPHAQKKQ